MTGGPATAIAIAASIGAGLIHLALGPEHIEELGLLGWGFYLAAAMQLGWVLVALAVFAVRGDRSAGRHPLRAVAIAGIAMNGAILAAWVVSRTAGLPAGEMPWMPEPVGRTDLISAALEVTVVAILARQWRSSVAPASERGGPARRSRGLAVALSIAAIVAGTAIGLTPDAAHAAAHDDAMSGQAHMLETVGQATP